MEDTLCPSFPSYQPCSCPLLKGEMDLKQVMLPVPDFGPILGSLMAVSTLRRKLVKGEQDRTSKDKIEQVRIRLDKLEQDRN
jgi:hypothetical protein